MTLQRLRILIVEDVPMDAELVEYELRRSSIPFEARCVDTQDGFLHQLAEFQPDLILSDYTLPRFDGMADLATPTLKQGETVADLLADRSAFEDFDAASPLLSRCLRFDLARRDLARAFAERAKHIAEREGLDGTLRHAGGWVAGIAKSLAFNERRKFATYRRHLERLAAGQTSGYANPPKGRARKLPRSTPSLFAN